ncbi:SMC-Scp complex subunit ScpB [Alicyclobacillus acidocaldarius]|uniref:Segregation and condensation protein B n=1 Tax=Alicyclobacillus acidocaldarius subsp. acidocaldarius (strain ATCC 27009 / DSM 446 / BCRC 14685 / JCM 5260 / KCTC 1825 / NBRC 15652 / NCIMB 11725 / NRRL B-14509 / 104-IA) TaxID=521098 RepID=C8WXC5_ALIAD|nr:SMC-Scp complex subunit ScpB [Alicyclobacillus acidocaldarius]ACV58747.1 chromosome segregation and condensation protein, ScpB [Alicyclobacillus acidocaldarius subsp. acidocaldarius DSM 446]
MELVAALEAVLFAAGSEGMTTRDIAQVLDVPEGQARDLCHLLAAHLEERGAGLTLLHTGDTWQLVTRPEFAPYFRRMADQPARSSLSQAALEVLAIISYKQPITRAEIEEIRGVQSDRALATLIHRGLVQEVGRQDGPGRPILYGTTMEFLRQFGLRSLDELPPLPDFAGKEGRPDLFAMSSDLARD